MKRNVGSALALYPMPLTVNARYEYLSTGGVLGPCLSFKTKGDAE